MNQNRTVLPALSIAFILGVAGCTPSKDDKPPAPKVAAVVNAVDLPTLGPAPAWTLQDLNGHAVTLEQFKGKVIVLDFWATWCAPCRMEIPGYIELTKKYGPEGLVVIGVSVDEGGPEIVKPFTEKLGVNYQIVMGNDAVATAYGASEVLPTTVIIDRNGQVRHRKLGAEEPAEYEPKVLAILREKT